MLCQAASLGSPVRGGAVKQAAGYEMIGSASVVSGVLAVFSSECTVSLLLSKNANIKICIAIILPAFLRGC
jgi:hypothetical protein